MNILTLRSRTCLLFFNQLKTILLLNVNHPWFYCKCFYKPNTAFFQVIWMHIERQPWSGLHPMSSSQLIIGTSSKFHWRQVLNIFLSFLFFFVLFFVFFPFFETRLVKYWQETVEHVIGQQDKWTLITIFVNLRLSLVSN